ncbi:MAG TPA: DUF4878 domain-containing protein [Thermoanaerobaculia bacterium]|nr:DUF4878 domain-containing protein [Thermoanaerobaculia bacterium]
MRRKSVICTLLVCAALAWGCTGRSPSSAVQSFYKALGDGDSDKAMSLFSQQTINMIGEEKLKAGIQGAALKLMEKGGLKHLEITNEQVSGNLATVVAVLKYGEGSMETEKIQLVKEQGGWRLQPQK